MNLNIAFSTDDNYVQHLGVALTSLLQTNSLYFTQIRVHILSNNISQENLDRFKAHLDNKNIIFHLYDVKEILAKLSKDYNIPDTISISAYARLFLPILLPQDIDKLIYADCDSVFNDSLIDILKYDLEDYLVAGVEDHVGLHNKTLIDLPKEFRYINSGMLLINLKRWRDENLLSKMIAFIVQKNGNVCHHDQGVINAVCKDQILYLNPKYNAMTSFWEFDNVAEITKFYGATNYYNDELIHIAKIKPVFIHFTPGFSKRPWIEGCRHPLKARYLEFKKKSGWKDVPLQKDNRSLKFKFLDFLFWNFGPRFYKTIFK